MKAEINSRVEFVQILLYLANEQEKTVQCLNNKMYSKSISDWFAPYKYHTAVQITKKLITESYFFHIRPLKAILNLENILHDDSHDLNLWANEVVRFAKESDFDGFFRTQSEYYENILEHINSCDFDTWISYIDNYFKSSPNDFHLIICPIAGNYGFNISRGEQNIAYTVCCMPHYENDGTFNWHFDYFAKRVAHEYAHCFVNPVIESNKELLKMHAQFFASHKNMPKSYNVDYAVINEYFVRAFQIRFMEENHTLFSQFDIPAEYERQRESFIFINDFVELLKEYENSRMTFREFYKQKVDEILCNCYRNL